MYGQNRQLRFRPLELMNIDEELIKKIKKKTLIRFCDNAGRRSLSYIVRNLHCFLMHA